MLLSPKKKITKGGQAPFSSRAHASRGGDPNPDTSHIGETEREREGGTLAGRRRAAATPGVRPSHGHGSGGKREKERRSEKRRVGAVVAVTAHD